MFVNIYRLFVIWPLFGQLWNLSKNSLLLISSTWCWNFWSWVHVFPCSFVMFFLHVPYKQCHSPWNNRKRYVRNEKYDQLQDFLHEKLPQTTTDTQLPPFVICGSKKHTTSAAGVWRNIYSLRQLHVPDQVQSCLQEMERFKTNNLDSKAYDMLYVYTSWVCMDTYVSKKNQHTFTSDNSTNFLQISTNPSKKGVASHNSRSCNISITINSSFPCISAKKNDVPSLRVWGVSPRPPKLRSRASCAELVASVDRPVKICGIVG